MPVFTARSAIQSSPAAVAAFHRDPRALKRLSPPPMWVQLHTFDPLANGSKVNFTLWLGPIPIRWLAQHDHVDAHGFTDRQVRGPMQAWAHTHRWTENPSGGTWLEDRVEYQHRPGWRGLFTRLLFARPMLRVLFTWRHWMTRRAVE